MEEARERFPDNPEVLFFFAEVCRVVNNLWSVQRVGELEMLQRQQQV